VRYDSPESPLVRWLCRYPAVIWATYASILGFAFGSQFEDDHTLAFLLAFGAALTITVLIEVVRYFVKKRAGRLEAKAAVCRTDDQRAR